MTGADSVTLSIDQTATEKRDEAVAVARMLPDDITDENLEAAVESIRELKGISQSVEETRVAIKRPIDAIAKKIQETAKTFVADVDIQIERLNKGVNALHAAKAKKARDEAQAAEKKRLEDEKAEKDRQAKIEKDRMDAIRANQPPPPPPPQTRVVVQPVFAMSPVAPKPKGLTSKREPKFRVESNEVLAMEHPEWVTIEPKAKLILDHVRSMGVFDGEQKIGAGLTVFWQDVAQVRV